MALPCFTFRIFQPHIMMHIQALVSSANCLPMDMHLRDRHTDGLTDSAHLGTESNKKIFKMIQDIWGLCGYALITVNRLKQGICTNFWTGSIDQAWGHGTMPVVLKSCLLFKESPIEPPAQSRAHRKHCFLVPQLSLQLAVPALKVECANKTEHDWTIIIIQYNNHMFSHVSTLWNKAWVLHYHLKI